MFLITTLLESFVLENSTQCAGAMQGEDEDCPIGDCECDGQLRVSNDCKEAK